MPLSFRNRFLKSSIFAGAFGNSARKASQKSNGTLCRNESSCSSGPMATPCMDIMPIANRSECFFSIVFLLAGQARSCLSA